MEGLSRMFIYTQEIDFKPFIYTNGRIELGFPKPYYWDYESFKIFRKGWNECIDEINALIKKVQKAK